MLKAVAALALLLAAAPARAEPDTPYAACETAIAAAQKTPHLPDKLMPAISRVESGRLDPLTKQVRAWPWTINVEGAGFFFDTKGPAGNNRSY